METILSVKQLTKKQPRDLFTNLSFEIKQGDWLSLVGPNGIGKSTLAHILIGLEPFTDGTILFQKDLNLTSTSQMEWVRKIQLIPQYNKNSLDPSKRILNLLLEPLNFFHKELSKEDKLNRITQLLKDCQLSQNILKQKPGDLSGGQYQRVCIILALLVDPDILICDEITAGLDSITERLIIKLLKQQPELSVIFISHQKNLIDLVCNKTLTLPEGKVKK